MARVQLLALLCLAASLLSLGAQATTGPDATKVGVYELKLGDFSVKVTNWGARLMSVVLPDSKGSSVQSSLSISSCCRLCICLDVVIALALALVLAPRRCNSLLGSHPRLKFRLVRGFAGNLADVVLGRDTLAEYFVRSAEALLNFFSS